MPIPEALGKSLAKNVFTLQKLGTLLKSRFKKEQRLLYSRIRSIHTSIGVDAQWNSDDGDVPWTELRIARVVINSPPDISKKLNVPEQVVIDESDILLELLGI